MDVFHWMFSIGCIPSRELLTASPVPHLAHMRLISFVFFAFPLFMRGRREGLYDVELHDMQRHTRPAKQGSSGDTH